MPTTILINVYWNKYRRKGPSLMLVYKNNSRNVFGHWNKIKTILKIIILWHFNKSSNLVKIKSCFSVKFIWKNTTFDSKDNFYYNRVKKNIISIIIIWSKMTKVYAYTIIFIQSLPDRTWKAIYFVEAVKFSYVTEGKSPNSLAHAIWKWMRSFLTD